MPVKFRPCALQHGMGRMRESKKAGSLQRKHQTRNAMTSAVLSALNLLTLWQLYVWFFANLYNGPKLVKCRKGAEPAGRHRHHGPAHPPPALPQAPAGTQTPYGDGLRAGPSWSQRDLARGGSPTGTEGTSRGPAAPSAGPGRGKAQAAAALTAASGPAGPARPLPAA